MQIQPCGPLRGEITVPGDKSISHRAVMLGALANGTTHITGFLMGEDCLSTIDCFRKMGVEINITDDEVIVEGVGLHGLEAPSEALAQDENRSAWAATREASWAFRGNLMKLFVFDLSFIGWYILTAVVLWGCILLGTVGLTVMSTGMAIAVFAAALVAALCLTAVLNGFLSAYMESSFVCMYEHLTEPSVEFYSEG